MLNAIKKFLGLGPGPDYGELVRQGATILDVRTPKEFQSGHIKGSVNIPLQDLQNSMAKIKKDKPVITCCASGVRSAAAKNILNSNGFTTVYNGGSWVSLQNKIK